MKEIQKKAAIENAPYITELVDEILENADCPPKVQVAVDIAIDEIFSNICFYAYGGDGKGDATIIVDIEDDPKAVSICFVDSGVPYNPLEKPDPDIELPVEERPIGGLGIFMVKNSMDRVSYEYKDGQNRFTIYKLF